MTMKYVLANTSGDIRTVRAEKKFSNEEIEKFEEKFNEKLEQFEKEE